MCLTILSLSPIANHRFFTHFGEAHCRMSSNQSIVDLPERKRSLILSAISLALFGLPNERRESLEGLWVDALTYTSAWRKYISNTVEDLKQRIIWVSSFTAIGYTLAYDSVQIDFRTHDVRKPSTVANHEDRADSL
jgi:hypothetical protein